jgi:mRNA interferase RelE/StbE
VTWQIRTTAAFDKALKKLDRSTAAQIIAAIERIAGLDDPRSTGKPLTGPLAGYWRYRIGDYRVLAEIQDARLTIVAIDVGHRSKVYRGR